MKYQQGNAVVVLIGIWILGAIGWGLNVYHLYHAIMNETVASAVVRGIGVFVAPLGAVLGYIPF